LKNGRALPIDSSPETSVLKLHCFSREAAAAHSCGRQPAEIKFENSQAAKRRKQNVAPIAGAASRLKTFF
jgi:hypothetical protein